MVGQLFLDDDWLVKVKVQEDYLLIIAGLEDCVFNVVIHKDERLLVLVDEFESIFKGSQSSI